MWQNLHGLRPELKIKNQEPWSCMLYLHAALSHTALNKNHIPSYSWHFQCFTTCHSFINFQHSLRHSLKWHGASNVPQRSNDDDFLSLSIHLWFPQRNMHHRFSQQHTYMNFDFSVSHQCSPDQTFIPHPCLDNNSIRSRLVTKHFLTILGFVWALSKTDVIRSSEILGVEPELLQTVGWWCL